MKTKLPPNQWVDNAHPFGGGAGNEYQTVTNQGRWAANFILMDDGAAAALDRQSGVSVSTGGLNPQSNSASIFGEKENRPYFNYQDIGGASRFFFRVQEQIDAADPVYYEAKASTEERDAGLNDLPVGRGSSLNGGNAKRNGQDKPQLQERHNVHPTVKPISLARYLATLLLPPTEYQPRKLFIPFAGVASECIGAMQAGWDEITGIEMTEEYIPIAEARIQYWKNRGWQTNLL